MYRGLIRSVAYFVSVKSQDRCCVTPLPAPKKKGCEGDYRKWEEKEILLTDTLTQNKPQTK